MSNRIEIHIPESATELQRERVNDLYNDVVSKNPKALVTIQEGIYPTHRFLGLKGIYASRFNFIFEPNNKQHFKDIEEDIAELKRDDKKLLGEIRSLEGEIVDLEGEIVDLEGEIVDLEEQQEKIHEEINQLESLKEEFIND